MINLIQVNHLSKSYDGKTILNELTFKIEKGSFNGIIGPNGSGKSTLLKMIAGVVQPDQGEILFHNRNIKTFKRKDLAQFLAVLPQEEPLPFAFTVREVIEMGRYPHQSGFFTSLTCEDLTLINQVIQELRLNEVEDCPIQQLSGGQKQRVLLARLFVQQPELILLDEPTNHLDIFFQIELLNLLKKWGENRQITVVSVLHDINLTSLYADKVMLLNGEGHLDAYGKVKEVLNTDRIKKLFGTSVIQIEHPIYQKPQFVLITEN